MNVESALNQTLKKGAPVDFRLAEGDADAEERAFAVGADAQRHQHGAVAQLAVLADLFVAGIEDEIGKGAERAFAPFFQSGVEEFGPIADVGGTDGRAAQFLDEGGHLAGGNALDIPFGAGEFEGLFGADPFLQRGGIEGHVAADLRDVEGAGAAAGGEGFIFETVGLALTVFGAFVRPGLERVGAFAAQGFIDEAADALAQLGDAVFGEVLQDGVQAIRIGGVGQGMVWCWMCLAHPNRKPL